MTKTVADLRADLDHACHWNSVGGAFGTAQNAVAALERVTALLDRPETAVVVTADEVRAAIEGVPK